MHSVTGAPALTDVALWHALTRSASDDRDDDRLLVEALDDLATRSLRRRAAWLGPVARAAVDHRSPAVRAACLSALNGARGRRALAAIERGLDDEDAEVRTMAVRALRTVASAEPARWIHAVAHRRAAVRALAAAVGAPSGAMLYSLPLLAEESLRPHARSQVERWLSETDEIEPFVLPWVFDAVERGWLPRPVAKAIVDRVSDDQLVRWIRTQPSREDDPTLKFDAVDALLDFEWSSEASPDAPYDTLWWRLLSIAQSFGLQRRLCASVTALRERRACWSASAHVTLALFDTDRYTTLPFDERYASHIIAASRALSMMTEPSSEQTNQRHAVHALLSSLVAVSNERALSRVELARLAVSAALFEGDASALVIAVAGASRLRAALEQEPEAAALCLCATGPSFGALIDVLASIEETQPSTIDRVAQRLLALRMLSAQALVALVGAPAAQRALLDALSSDRDRGRAELEYLHALARALGSSVVAPLLDRLLDACPSRPSTLSTLAAALDAQPIDELARRVLAAPHRASSPRFASLLDELEPTLPSSVLVVREALASRDRGPSTSDRRATAASRGGLSRRATAPARPSATETEDLAFTSDEELESALEPYLWWRVEGLEASLVARENPTPSPRACVALLLCKDPIERCASTLARYWPKTDEELASLEALAVERLGDRDDLGLLASAFLSNDDRYAERFVTLAERASTLHSVLAQLDRWPSALARRAWNAAARTLARDAQRGLVLDEARWSPVARLALDELSDASSALRDEASRLLATAVRCTSLERALSAKLALRLSSHDPDDECWLRVLEAWVDASAAPPSTESRNSSEIALALDRWDRAVAEPSPDVTMSALVADVERALLSDHHASERQRFDASLWLWHRGVDAGLSLFLHGLATGLDESPSWLSTATAAHLEAIAEMFVTVGEPTLLEEAATAILDGPMVDGALAADAWSLLLQEATQRSTRQLAIDALNRSEPRRVTKTSKLQALARVFAWGAQVGVELTGRAMKIQLAREGELGYTRLYENCVWVSALPLLRGERSGRAVVEGLLLHEFGHHRYHRGEAQSAAWSQASAEGIGPLLNLVADEHLERNLRALDPAYGDRLKKLDAYAFQHMTRPLSVRTLFEALRGSLLETLSTTSLQFASDPSAVIVAQGSLLSALERQGSSFARWVRALRMGLGDRHGDEKVARALALFARASFRKSSMDELLAVAREIRRIFEDECPLMNVIPSHEAVGHGDDGDFDRHSEGITDDELRREVDRIIHRQRRGDSYPTAGSGKRWINVTEETDFDLIHDVVRLRYDGAQHRSLSARVRRSASTLRMYLTRLGLHLEPQRLRVRGRRVDPSRLRALVTRGDPRVLVTREVQSKTDLFIGVLVDCSGSMSSRDNMERARLFAALIAEAARAMPSIDVRIFGFTDRVIYDAGDAARPAVHALEANGGNNDSAALWFAANVARASHRRAKLLVMISDGLPTECSAASLEHLAHELTRRHKMCCAQIAVQALPEVLFPHYVVCDGPDTDGVVRRFGAIVETLVKRAIGMP